MTNFTHLKQIKVLSSFPNSYLAQLAERLQLEVTLKEFYASSNPGRVHFLSSILIANCVCVGFWEIFTSITIDTLFCLFIFSSPEPKAHAELIVNQSSRRPSVRACVRSCVRLFTLSNISISATSRPIATKFYLKHHWGRGNAAIGFWPDQV